MLMTSIAQVFEWAGKIFLLLAFMIICGYFFLRVYKPIAVDGVYMSQAVLNDESAVIDEPQTHQPFETPLTIATVPQFANDNGGCSCPFCCPAS